jgi:uncharacterized protein
VSAESPELHQERVGELVLAAHGDLAKVTRLLAERPELVNERWERFDETALEAAGHTGRREIAELLLTAGAPLTVFAAAMLGRGEEFAGFLAADRSLASARGVHGISLLYHVALSGRTDLAELLRELGPLDGLDDAVHAAVRGGHVEMVRWLLDQGAKPTALNFDGKTPLQAAEEGGLEDVAAALRDSSN